MYSQEYYLTEEFHDALASGNQSRTERAWTGLALMDRPAPRITGEARRDEVAKTKTSCADGSRSVGDNQSIRYPRLEVLGFRNAREEEWRNRIDEMRQREEWALSRAEEGRNWR